jgi:hypothetical protein
MTDDTYTLTFRPLPDEAPAAIRVRRLLKHALRALRLKCVRIVDLPADKEPARRSTSHRSRGQTATAS